MTQTRILEANALVELGMLEANDDPKKAHGYYVRALTIYKEEKHVYGEARVLNNIGVYHFERDEIRKAKEYFTQSLKLHRQTGNTISEALLLGNLSNVVMDLGDISQSIEYARMAIDIQQRIGDDNKLARTLSNLGNTLVYIGQQEEALRMLERALQLSKKVENHILQGFILEQFIHATDDLQQKKVYLKQVRAIYSKEYELRYQYTHVTHAQIDIEEKKWNEAEKRLLSVRLYFVQKQHHYVEQIHILLALIYARTNRLTEAQELISNLEGHYTSPSLQNLFYQTRILEIYILCEMPEAKILQAQLEQLIQNYTLEQYPQSQGFLDFQRVKRLA